MGSLGRLDLENLAVFCPGLRKLDGAVSAIQVGAAIAIVFKQGELSRFPWEDLD